MLIDVMWKVVHPLVAPWWLLQQTTMCMRRIPDQHRFNGLLLMLGITSQTHIHCIDGDPESMSRTIVT